MTAQHSLNLILRAWNDEGPRPAHHRLVKAWVKRNWPSLFNAIEMASRDHGR